MNGEAGVPSGVQIFGVQIPKGTAQRIVDQIDDLVAFNDFKGFDYQLPQRLKLLDCFPYVMESREVYEIY